MDFGRVDYLYFYQLFGLSFRRHPFTKEDPLVILNFSKSVPTKKQTHLHLGWPKGEYILIIFSFFV